MERSEKIAQMAEFRLIWQTCSSSEEYLRVGESSESESRLEKLSPDGMGRKLSGRRTDEMLLRGGQDLGIVDAAKPFAKVIIGTEN
jgi:hypothetical protein